MTNLHSMAARAAQGVVDAFTGSGLAQDEGGQATGPASVTPGMPELARQAAAEGCVLLTNDGTLPLSPTDEVAVFGRCQLDWFFVGYGSGGNVHAPYLANLMDGLDLCGARYNRVLAELYRSWCGSEEQAADHGFWGHWPLSYPEMPVGVELAQAAAHTADTALVVIGRATGEDRDNELAPGGYYLTSEERSLLDAVTSAFAHTVAILDVGNVIDLSWTQDYAGRLSAVLLAYHGGMEAGNAVAEVLYGVVNPCGRLADTVARSYGDYPSSATFGSKDAVDYAEGVFVGYRHFLTTAPDRMLFPFGHGLSYTSFDVACGSLSYDGETGTVEVLLTNTGKRAGKEVAQLWCAPPRSLIDKPNRVLVAFGKTRLLQPGETERLSLTFDNVGIAIFDEARHAYMLDPGTYELFLNERRVGSFEQLTAREVRTCEPIRLTSEELRERILGRLPDELPPATARGTAFSAVLDGTVTLEEFVAELSDAELAALTCGEGSMNSKLGPAGNAGAFGGVTRALRRRGIPAAICADGPAGLRLGRHCSLLPCASALACTWDVELVERLFALEGAEVRANGVDVLLAPGMNIHRDPLCGRNFEYFSEDPLLTGRLAAAVTRGLQGAGVAACPKHFACNNQELRRNTSDSRVSERALHEIYLRGFELCVREAHPRLIMTSYNKVNGVWAHYHYDLVTTVLRREWGFAGTVITDWWMRRATSPEFPELRDNAYRVRAGVDVLMPGNLSRVLPSRAKPAGVTRAELEQTALHVLSFFLAQEPDSTAERVR